jgi:cold shock CspA family protein
MSKSKQTSGKKEREKQHQRNKKDKEARKEERKMNSNKGKGMESMMAYVDEFGRLTDTPPDPTKKRTGFSLDNIQISVPKQREADPEDAFRKGTITFFNDEKGYGFIKDLVTQESVFVHINQMEGELKEGNKVSFEVEMGQKGPVAVRVRKSE